MIESLLNKFKQTLNESAVFNTAATNKLSLFIPLLQEGWLKHE